MPWLQNSLAALGPRDQVVCFARIRRQGLFHQQIQPRIQQRRRYFVMLHRRDSHARRIQFQVCMQQLVHAGKNRNSVLLLRLFRARCIGLNCRNQCCTLACGLQFAQHPQMIATKRSSAGHRHAQLLAHNDLDSSFLRWLADW